MTTVQTALLGLIILHTGNCVETQKVRLIPGPNKGRLEVFYEGVWGTVCQSSTDYSTTNRAASVICRILNQPTKNSHCVSGKKYSAGVLHPKLDAITCSGMETSLSSCTLTPKGSSSTCKRPDNVIGIECTDATMQATINFGGRWYDLPQRIYAPEGQGIGCYAGINTFARDFTCSMRSSNGFATGQGTAGYLMRRAEAGPITCTVSNWQMPNQSTLTLDLVVLYAPTVQCQQAYVVTEGSKVNITCEIDANPPPHSYIWTDSSGNVISQGSNPSLLIPSVGPDSAGQYMLTVSNKMAASVGGIAYGTAQARIIITLEGDGVSDTSSTIPSQPRPQPPSAVTYAMIAVGVVSLVAVLVLVAVVIKMWKTRAGSSEPQERNDTLTTVRNGGHPNTYSVMTAGHPNTYGVPERNSQRSSGYLHVSEVVPHVSDGSAYDTVL